MDTKPESQIDNEKVTVTKEEPTNGENEQSYVGSVDGDVSGGKAKKKKMNIFLYWLLSIGSFGLWNRFRPRKGGWKGSWFVTTIMLALLSSALITERFYKSEFNDMARAQLELEVDVLPDVLPFEQGKIIESQDSKLEIETLKHQVLVLEDKNTELNKSLDNAKIAYEKKQGESEQLAANFSKALDERDVQINNLKMELEAQGSVSQLTREAIIEYETSSEIKNAKAEIMSFSVSSLEQAGNEVGCKTKFSVERSSDVFEKSYSKHLVKWTGDVVTVNNDYVEIQVKGDSKAKARIMFANKGDGYYMVKGETITMQATLTEKADCESPFLAEAGFQVAEAK